MWVAFEPPGLAELQQPLADRVDTLPVAHQHLADQRQVAAMPVGRTRRRRRRPGDRRSAAERRRSIPARRCIGIQQQHRAEPLDQPEPADGFSSGRPCRHCRGLECLHSAAQCASVSSVEPVDIACTFLSGTSCMIGARGLRDDGRLVMRRDERSAPSRRSGWGQVRAPGSAGTSGSHAGVGVRGGWADSTGTQPPVPRAGRADAIPRGQVRAEDQDRPGTTRESSSTLRSSGS